MTDYAKTGNPQDDMRGISSFLRNEFELIETAINSKLNSNLSVVGGAEAQGATVNDYVITVSPAITAYTTGSIVIAIATHTNIGACTLKISALAAKTLKDVDGGALASGDIASGSLIAAYYDGTDFFLLSGNDRVARGGDAYTGAHDFTGATITAATAAAGTNTVQLATTAHVFSERSNTATLTNKTLTAPTINGPSGIVKGDVGLGNVDNTTDVDKPISTATQAELSAKAPLASPTFTGVPSGPTAAPGTNTTQFATTAFVDAKAFLTALPSQAGNSGKFVTTDGTNASWAALPSGGETSTTSTVLTASSKAVQILSMTEFGKTLTLPDATALTIGSNTFVLDNSQGRYPVGIIDGGARVLGQVLPGDLLHMHLVGQADAAGTWRYTGNIDPRFIDTETALNLATYGSGVNWLNLDADRAFVYYYTVTNNYPAVRLITYNSGAGVAPTVSNELVLKAAATSINTDNTLLVGTSNRALVRLNDSTVVCVDLSNPASITVGASVSLTFTGGSLNKILSIDDQYLIAAASDSGAKLIRAKCIDCGASGTTVTMGAEANTASYSYAPTYIFGKKIATTAIGVFGQFNNTTSQKAILHTVTRTSGTTLSWSANAGDPTNYRTDSTTQLNVYFDIASDKLLLPYYRNSAAGSYVVVTFAASSTPTFGTVQNSNVAASGLTFGITGSPNMANFIGYVNGSSAAKNIENVTVSGATITVGAATSVTADATIDTSANMQAAIDNNGRGWVSWRSVVWGSGSDGNDKYRVFATSANVFTFSAETAGINKGALNGLNYSFVVADYQNECGSGVFTVYANIYNGSAVKLHSRNEYFTVNADCTITKLATVHLSNSSQLLNQFLNVLTGVYAVSILYSPPTDPIAQNLVVWAGGGYKLGRSEYLSGNQPHNALAAPNQRILPMMLVTPDTQFGRNASIYTFRFAEA